MIPSADGASEWREDDFKDYLESADHVGLIDPKTGLPQQFLQAVFSVELQSFL